MGNNNAGPGNNRPVRPGGHRQQHGALRGGVVPGQAPDPNAVQGANPPPQGNPPQGNPAQGNQGQGNPGQGNQAQQGNPLPPLPQAPPNIGLANRPVRPGGHRQQHGALRGGVVPGQAPNPNAVQGANPPPQGNPPQGNLGQGNQAQGNLAQNPPPQVNPPPPQPPPLPQVKTPTPVIPVNQRTGANRDGTLSTRTVDRMPPDQRQWSDNVLRALKLKSKGSQARVLAGAIATSTQIGQATPADADEAKRLLGVVQEAGDPPWKDARKAMAAADAAMKLDFLSIPQAQRQLEVLGENKGVNSAFLVNREDSDGQTRPAFLCKPANRKDDPNYMDKVPGIPDGGEVVREALVSRAAQTFAAQTGIDVHMPESHVVQLSSAMFPPPDPNLPPGPPLPPQVTCSIQEFGPGMKQLKSLTRDQKAAIPAEQVAALAVFDLMTLNTDRHSGNIMSDGQGGMLPIDHGASFVEGPDGRSRIREALGGPHNALLKLPAAFEPMPNDMVKKLKALKTSDYRESLENDRNDIVAVHGDMDGLLTDESLDWAQKAARFAKLCARNRPPLSPGLMQVAFASNVDELLDAADFDAAAQGVIVAALAHSGTVKAVCLQDDVEHAEMVRKLKLLGWTVQERGEAPLQDALADPVLMLSIIELNLPGNSQQQRTASLAQAKQNLPGANTLKTRLLTMRKDLVRQMIALMDANARQAETNALAGLTGTEDQQMAESQDQLDRVRIEATMAQLAVLNGLLANGASPTSKAARNAQRAAEVEDPIQMAIEITDVR